ncbi:penicillin-binding protein 2 [Candidatus Saccharibacteria bacterium]|nr:penicillin-binding protein 2 [Candidatus Saccharibacteria bacterium]
MPRNNQSSLRQNISKSTRGRIKILQNVVLIAFAIIAVRLFFIQIIEHGMWVAKANEQHTLLETIVAKRGEIYMMDKGEPVPVVLNQTTYQIIIDPAITEREPIEQALKTHAEPFIAANFDEIYRQEGLRYAIVAKNVPRELAEKIASEDIGAVWFKKNNQRVYPEGQLASGLLGFVNADGIGQYGVEGSLNQILSGKDGLLKTTSDVNNVALSIGKDNVKIPAEDGKNVILSIDRSLEKNIERLAADAINQTAATNASVLIMNPNTGEVLTMANLPNYTPANYGDVVDASAYNNYTLDIPYEPASICKNFAFSAAINEGVMTPDTTFFNKHYEEVDDWKIWNAEQRGSLYGTLTMRDALYWSLNTGSIYALKLLGGNPNSINQQGREKLFDYYYNKFRLGRVTGIELAEAEGFIPDPNEGWGRDSTYANLTFGQNLSITMLQTATAFSAVVNGGTWRTPSVVKGYYEDGKIVSADDLHGQAAPSEGGSTTESTSSQIEDKILSDDTSAMMRGMLINNREYLVRGGIDRPGYDIGGKSGTAQVVKNGAYDDSFAELVGSYIGFIAPSGEMPEYVIMTKMWGEGQSIGSGDAMNLFNSLSNFLIDYYKIKPGAM